MPALLANFGPSAIEPLKAVVLDEGLDGFVRGAASKALVVIAYNYSECREPIIKLLWEIIRDAEVRAAEEALWYLTWYLNILKASSYNLLICKGENKNDQN